MDMSSHLRKMRSGFHCTPEVSQICFYADCQLPIIRILKRVESSVSTELTRGGILENLE